MVDPLEHEPCAAAGMPTLSMVNGGVDAVFRYDSLLRDRTPVRAYRIGRKIVHVKRDDLFGRHPAPPLGKLRGLVPVLERLHASGQRLVGCWDTRISQLGHGLAVLASRFDGMRTVVVYPAARDGREPENVALARQYGAVVVPDRGNVPLVAWGRARKLVQQLGGSILPFGLECAEAVEAVAAEFRRVRPSLYERGTIVVSAGSGVTVSGILRGVRAKPRRVIAVSAGRSVQLITQTIRRQVGDVPHELVVLPAKRRYADPGQIECPFPCHPNYDLKAWEELVNGARQLPTPLFFWNVGATRR